MMQRKTDFSDASEPLDDSPHMRAKALNRVASMLAKRDHSELEIRQKLARNFSPAIVEEVLKEAAAQRWLVEPLELAERVSRQLSARGKSQGYIAGYLRSKGLPPVASDPELEAEKCRRVLKTKLGKTATLTFAEKGKAYRWLKQRGFADSVIKKVLHEEP